MATKKYVIELTRKDHDVLCNALFILGYDIDERKNCQSYYGKSKSDCERDFINTKKKIFCDLTTKAEYLRENKCAT